MPDFTKININGSTYNVKDETARTSITTLSSRMDSFTSLPDGSTSGDAELIDIRIGENGTVYENAGTAVRSQVSNLRDDINNALNNQFEKSYNPDYIATSGKYLGTNNTIGVNADYSISSPIPLLPGQFISVKASGSASSISILSTCQENGTLLQYVVSYSNSEATWIATFLNTSSTIQYVRCCWLTSEPCLVTIYNDHLIDPDNTFLIKCQSLFYKTDGTVPKVRFDENGAASDYTCTTPIHLYSGETIHLYGRAATSIPAIIRCDKNGGSRTFVVTGLGYTHHSYTAIEDCYVMVQYRANDAAIEVNKIPAWNTGKIVTDKRIGTVTFIFDDGVTQDSNIVSIFESKGLRCGFAIISSMATNNRVNEYLDYQSRGFSILSHSTDAEGMDDSTLDPTEINQKITWSKNYLRRAGFDIQGWVTPSSQMYEGFKQYLDRSYNYAYTTYYGTYQEGNRAYNLFSDSPFDLWRLDMFSSTENCKLAIDACVEERGFLTIYFHAAQMQETHEQRLVDLLDYINQYIEVSMIKCLAPNEAFNYYYAIRRSDLSNI